MGILICRNDRLEDSGFSREINGSIDELRGKTRLRKSLQAVLTAGTMWICLGLIGSKWDSVVIQLLTGKFARTIDEKQRIAIPKRLRDAFQRDGNQAVAYVAPGTDGSLSIYTEESFSKLADQLSAASPNGQEVRAFSRLFFSQAESLEIDRQGRVRIPPELVRHGDLKKEVMLVGVRDHLELWNREKWDEYVAQQQSNYDSLAEKAFTPKS